MNKSLSRLIFPVFCIVLTVAYLVSPSGLVSTPNQFDVKTFSELPVSYGGRIKPLDAVARNSLTILSGRQSLRVDGHKMPASAWLLDMFANPQIAADYKVFRIDHPDVRAILGLEDSKERRFSYRTILAKAEELERQAQQANAVPGRERTLYQNKIMELIEHANIYATLANAQGMLLVPNPELPEDFMTIASAMQRGSRQPDVLPVAQGYQQMLSAYHAGDVSGFNHQLAHVEAELNASHADLLARTRHEAVFNAYAPFSRAITLYLVVALLIFGAWLFGNTTIQRTAGVMLVIIWLCHTAGLATRIYLSGRPPVTNLYSSAVFVGWGCVALCLVLERLFKNGTGTITGATMGFLTLLIAQGLSGDGDTMAVLQAVLDTNFWLATHVVVITLGYSATYLAGFLGILFILRGVLTRGFDKTDARRLGQMIYGIVCFATLFSFLGTILGGIWADQSWGRFWGWDPKENGALIIVLWNALVLHARWSGLVRLRGLALLAIAGNIVTSWSWFGVNMLGAGLHSYGFMQSAAYGLGGFVCTQLVLIGLGLLPPTYWRSAFSGKEIPPDTPPGAPHAAPAT